jgi:hypothetical protein
MSPAKKTVQSTAKKGTPSLSELGHELTMDYLRMAQQSTNPEIVRVALDLAKRESKHQHKQTARVSRTTILWVNIVLGFVLTVWSIYAVLNYPPALIYELVGIPILVFVAVAAISLLLSGVLSEANFTKIISSVMSQLKALLTRNSKASGNPASTAQSPPDDSDVR